MKWCTNNCHKKPMWCGRKNCITKSEFAKKMQEKQDGSSTEDGGGRNGSSGTNKTKLGEDFKIAL